MLEIPGTLKSQPQSTPIIRPSVYQTQIFALWEWKNKSREKGIRVPKGQTKGWNAKVSISGLNPRDKERLKNMYNIPLSINIMIRSPYTLDNTSPLIGWIAFHEKAL